MARLFPEASAEDDAAVRRSRFIAARAFREFSFDEARGMEPATLLGRVHALAEAAGLAFATERSGEGRAQLALSVELMLTMPPDRWPVLRLALLGALAGRVTVRLGPDSVRLGAPGSEAWSEHALDAVDPRQAGALLAAALLTGQAGEEVLPLHPDAWRPEARVVPRVVMALAHSLEAGVLPWFMPGRSDQAWAAAFATVQRMEQRWRLELHAMLLLEHRRDLMILPASAVDWSLLAMRRALAGDSRRADTAHRFDDAAPDSFHAALAREFDRPDAART